MKEISCAVIGSPPLSFPWGYDEEDEICVTLKLLLLNRITFLRGQGVIEFYVVMDDGMGLYAAEMLNSLRERDESLRLVCIVPWEGQATKWTPELRERYYTVLEKCSEVKMTSTSETVDCVITSMLDAIDMSDMVIAVCGPDTILSPVALRYAERMNKQIIALDSDIGKLRV